MCAVATILMNKVQSSNDIELKKNGINIGHRPSTQSYGRFLTCDTKIMFIHTLPLRLVLDM